MDFGIAKELRAGSLTASGSLLGTPRYMSPEQWVGGEMSGAADQYSLGIVVYEMLSGELPFEASSAYELLNKHCNEPPIPLATHCPDLPDYVYGAVDRALAKKAEERFPTVTAFAEALAQPKTEMDPTVRVRLTGGKAKPHTMRRSIAGAALVAAAAIGGWLILGPGTTGTGENVPPSAEGESTLAAQADFETTSDAVTDTTGAASDEAEQAELPPPEDAISETPVATTAAPTAGPVLLVRMDGPWATVFLDGVMYAEETRGFRDALTAGRHVLRFERAGYTTIDTTVTLVSGETHTLLIRMVPEGS
jgi:serine/threonine-protein kinase